MDEKCHKTQDIDLALFLIEPYGAEWQEFRAHYPYCATCSTEIQKWTALEHRLRSLGNPGATGHPAPEILVQFHQHSTLLPAEKRDTIASHLSACVTCREEFKLLGTFDPSRIAQWIPDTKTIVSAEVRESWSTRVLNALRPLFLHPAFAAGLVLLLSVPFIRSYYLSSLNQMPVSSDVVQTSAPTPTLGRSQVSQEPTAGLKERQAAEPQAQVALSAPSPVQTSPPVALAPPALKLEAGAEKATEDTRPTLLAKRSAQREDFAAKDERAPTPPPASPVPSGTAGAVVRDEAVRPQSKSRAMVEEKKQPSLPEPQKPARVEEREARSTEGPVAQQRRQEEDASQFTTPSSVPVTAAARLQGNIVPQESQTRPVISALMTTYKNAYEARDLNTLGTVWNITPVWQEALTQLFAKSQQITLTLTLEENNLTESADQRQVSVPLTQTVTTVNSDGQTSTYGPFYCLVDIRKQNTGQWKIHDLQEDPQYPGQCRLP
jgi:hypothetical protein